MASSQVISRKAAIENGLKRYFTGKPCKWGHITERFTGGYDCCECSKLAKSTPSAKEYSKNYKIVNKTARDLAYRKRIDNHPIKIKLQYKAAQCKREGIPFNLTVEDISIPALCPLLGIPIEITLGKGSANRENGWSLDRIDPSKGYVKGNVWFISGKANRMKQEMTPAMMRHFADVIDCKLNKLDL